MVHPEKAPPRKTNQVAGVFQRPVVEKLILEARRAEEAGRRKFAIQKKAREANRQVTAMQRTNREHALSRALSVTVERSRQCIDSKTSTDITKAKDDLSDHLSHAVEDLNLVSKQALTNIRGLTRPIQAEGVQWQSISGQDSGTTDLGTIIKSLSREVGAKETQIAQQHVEWQRTQAALDSASKALLESATFECLIEGVFDPPEVFASNYETLQQEIEAARQKTMDELKQEDAIALKAMIDTDEACTAKVDEIDKMQQTFYDILTGDEY